MRTITKQSKVDPEEHQFETALGVHWKSILNAMSEGVSVHSTTGKLLWANKALRDIYHNGLSELELSECEPAPDEEDGHGHNQMLSGGSVRTEEHPSGKALSVQIEPLLDEQGRTWGFARIVRDVTEGRRRQDQLLETERFATLGQILSDVAHDIGTPLNVISGYCEFLLTRMKPGEPGHKELSSILNQSKRIATLLREALDMSRPPQGLTDVVDLESMLAGLLDLAANDLRKSGVKASLACRISPALIYGEGPQLRQALFNVLSNASQQLGANSKLEISVEELPDASGFLTITLRGRNANNLEHDFFSALASFLAGESEMVTPAIGLSLARQILRQAGAQVSSGTAGLEGNALIIRLPAASAHHTKQGSTAPTSE
jgi:signal transduction histidine kinase